MSVYSNVVAAKTVLISFMETDMNGDAINWMVGSCVPQKKGSTLYNVVANSDMGEYGMTFTWDGKVHIESVGGVRGVVVAAPIKRRGMGEVESDIVAVEAALAQLKMDLVASKSVVSESGPMGGNSMSVYWAESEDVTEPTMVVYIPSSTSRGALKKGGSNLG